MATVYYDLSHPIQNGMSRFPGDPKPRLMPARGVQRPWKVSDLRLGSHTGTHIDAAAHYVSGALSIDRYPLKRFMLPGIVTPPLTLEGNQPIAVSMLADLLPRIPKGGALLLQTNYDRHWNSKAYDVHPYLGKDAAQALRKAGVSLVGIDALNVDSTVDGGSEVHAILLGNDILIVENLAGLSQLEPLRLYHFSFLPLPLAGGDGSPIRATAWSPQSF